MANELQFYGDPSANTGLTVVARVYDAAGAQVGADVATTEVGALAIYQGDMPAAAAGAYGVRFFNGAEMVAQGSIEWDGTKEVDAQTLTADLSGLNNLSSADITAAVPTAAEIEAALLNEGDGQQLIDAIVVAIGNENITAATIAAQVRTELTTELARIDTEISTRSEAIDLVKLDELHAIHGLDAGNPMTVTPSSRVAGAIAQAITGDGETTSTVTRA